MAATVLAADLNISTFGTPITVQVPAAVDTYYQGAIVWNDVDSSGYATCAPAAGDRILGVSPTQQVISSAGDSIEVIVFGVVKFSAVPNALATTDAGAIIAADVSADGASDNITDMYDITGLTLADNDSILGKCLDTDGSSYTTILVNPGGKFLAAQDVFI